MAGIALLLSFTTSAQGLTDKVEAFGGYSFEHFASSPSFNTNGWEISGQYKVTSWIGALADVDGHYGTFEGVSSRVNNFLIGPQVSFPAPVSPFAHVLIGGSHFSAAGNHDWSFADGFGFGIDTRVAPQISWRIVQIDFIHTHLFNDSESNTRVSTGIVFRF